MREEGRRPQRTMPQALLCLRMATRKSLSLSASKQLKMALSYALDTPTASFAKKRRSASVVTASPFCFRISQSGELPVFL